MKESKREKRTDLLKREAKESKGKGNKVREREKVKESKREKVKKSKREKAKVNKRERNKVRERESERK